MDQFGDIRLESDPKRLISETDQFCISCLALFFYMTIRRCSKKRLFDIQTDPKKRITFHLSLQKTFINPWHENDGIFVICSIKKKKHKIMDLPKHNRHRPKSNISIHTPRRRRDPILLPHTHTQPFLNELNIFFYYLHPYILCFVVVGMKIKPMNV